MPGMSSLRKSPPLSEQDAAPRNTILRQQIEILRQTTRSRPTLIEEWAQDVQRDDSAERAVQRLTQLKASGKM
ncbi:hypothetical protein [Methylobacterium nonmethylotrophicum]|uniref:Uncharacterized protein n=1 Tax=Methylobacterium nonmethylotrophicum TaxID=1141884 RepID=A0A4Z0NJB0_9HYPH|nr:hypothetical protein [Methylobacterium nonmethylotrophicum]TGD96408.1 hypothetical protein EU555_23380 [Methylobacterium nonmethylotrophicum]